MTEDDFFESLGPLLYAISKSLLTYREAYNEAATIYKSLTGNEPASEKDLLSKIFSAAINEVEKTSETSAADFLKKYQQLGFFFSMVKKILG
jgi:hypothetical protein